MIYIAAFIVHPIQVCIRAGPAYYVVIWISDLLFYVRRTEDVAAFQKGFKSLNDRTGW